jgi:precorrin-6B methylase 2
MIAAKNPAAAIVLHASPSDVDSVFVNGEIVKQNGILKKVDWQNLKAELLQNAIELESRWHDVGWDKNTEELAEAWSATGKLE